MTGEIFGPYRLESLIGRGGMGEVYRAFDTRRNRVVALKRLTPEAADDVDFQARFRSEAAIAARLNEPHIIPIHDFGEIAGRLYIDMRLVEGRDLGQILATEGRLAADRAVGILAQVCSALDAAHAQGLVHRDIKPANILVTANPTDTGRAGEFAYVADFGIARSVASASSSLTRTGMMIGSLHYMAPERFGSLAIDRRVDVYSLGCMLYELLCGRRPFETDVVPALINAHLNAPPPRPSAVVGHLLQPFDAVVATAMAKNPDERFHSAGEFARAALMALQAAAGNVATSAPAGAPSTLIGVPRAPQGPAPFSVPSTLIGAPRAPQELPQAPYQGRTRRWPALVMVAVLAGALVGGAWWFFGSGSGTPQATTLEPIHAPGDNPFMPSVGDDRPGITPPSGSGGIFTGATVGLYGGTLHNASCDPDKMVAFLSTHPDQAAAWAGVEGIQASAIASYVRTLTPVVLRSDTAVVNHGYAGGKATTIPAVLQAGTAVLVDPYGVPRAKCFCGNPLSESTQPPTQFLGPAWPGFAQSGVTTVTASSSPATSLALVDLESGRSLVRPVGTSGGQDQEGAPASTSPPEPLFQVGHSTDAVGPSGDLADPAVTGVAGSANTGLWAGCEGTPANTRYAIGGGYRRLTATMRLAAYAPAGLVVRLAVLGDGAQLSVVTLSPGGSEPLDVDVSGVNDLTFALQVVGGTCSTAPAGYGVAVNAVLMQ